MLDPKNILVLHAGAIGDVMLATPVASMLKHNFPNTQLQYCVHSSLRELLLLTDTIDDVIDFRKEDGLMGQRRSILMSRPDLIVDLSGSRRSTILTAWSGARIVRYKKLDSHARPIQHAVDNFLSTLNDLRLERPACLFPTIFPGEISLSDKLGEMGMLTSPIVGLVPGVGKFRSHRSWEESSWVSIANRLKESGSARVILIGGHDEADLCERVAEKTGALNLVGKLTLSETAAVLARCEAVVSGDTGPAHIAIAVGRPVIGLYGPTYLERSGPYGCSDLSISRSTQCQCHDLKFCRLNQKPGSGKCMSEITVDDVWQKLQEILLTGLDSSTS